MLVIHAKNYLRYLLLISLFVVYSAITFGQQSNADFTSPSGQSSLQAGDPFSSLEAQFSIALPRKVSGFRPLSYDTPEGHITGESYSWRTVESQYTISYVRRPENLSDVTVQKNFFDNYRRAALVKLDELKGKLISETELSIAGNPGLELRVEFNNGVFIERIYIHSPRIYRVAATVKNSQQVDDAIKILNTFKLLSTLEIDAAIRKQVLDAEPEGLPQTPIAEKLKSDLEDGGLIGKVSKIATDYADLSFENGISVERPRTPTSSETYNERGNLVRRVSYDWKGNVRDITVFGYLDGVRASLEKSIHHEYDPPPMMIAAPPAGQPKPQYDARYSQKFKFKYDIQGNLEEKLWYGNDGKLRLRYVYKSKGNQLEMLVYDEDGSLNQRYSSILDDKKNKLEMNIFDVKDNSIRERYSYAYEYDSKGNWIKQTVSKWVTKDGKSFFELDYVSYRTLTYY